MNKLVWIAMLWSMTGCASQQRLPTMSGPAAQKSLTAYARNLLDHIAQGDFAYMKQSMCEEAVVYDIDENGAPITRRGEAAVGALLDHHQAMLAAPGSSMSLVVQRLDCDRHAEFCTIEFDQTLSMGGRMVGPLKFHATLVAKQHGDKWIWTHWHASYRELPPTLGPAAPPEPDVPAAAAPAPGAPPAPSGPPPAPEPAKPGKKTG